MSEYPSTEEFARLFAVNHRRIYAYVRSLVPHRADSDEVFQETCVVLWREFKTFAPGTNFLAWALAVALNQVRSYRHRVRGSRVIYSEDLVAALEQEQRQVLSQQDARGEALEHCLEELRERDRQIIRLYYAEAKRTAGDVAEQLNRPVNTIYKALARIRRTLYECIQQRSTAELS